MKAKLVVVSILAATLILVPAVVLSQRQETTVQAPVASVPLNADTILTLVNKERTAVGLKPLVSDPRLTQTAQARADDMNTRNYFAHFDPMTGKNLVNIGLENPGLCSYASENIGNITHPEPDLNTSMVSSWMGSKSHHDAILDARYTITGVAISGTKVVQHFCIVN